MQVKKINRKGFNSLVDKDSNYDKFMLLLSRQEDLLARQENLITRHERILNEKATDSLPVDKRKKFTFTFYKDLYNEERWAGSYFGALLNETPQTKGALGQRSVQIMLEELGFRVEWVGKGEDLKVWRENGVSKEEVKTKFVNHIITGNESVWFNQVRIKKEEIRLYHFVVVTPNKIEILAPLDRDEFDFNKLSNGHGGTKELKSLGLIREKGRDFFYNKKLNLTFRTVFSISKDELTIKVLDLKDKSNYTKGA